MSVGCEYISLNVYAHIQACIYFNCEKISVDRLESVWVWLLQAHYMAKCLHTSIPLSCMNITISRDHWAVKQMLDNCLVEWVSFSVLVRRIEMSKNSCVSDRGNKWIRSSMLMISAAKRYRLLCQGFISYP